MNEIKSIPNFGENAEIHALIESMKKAAIRLEELTAGEIDSVAGINGRMFLLQHAQEQLRINEALRQAAILKALPAHIALIHTDGQIISMNEGWKQFSVINMFAEVNDCIGLNYIEICKQTIWKDIVEAQQVEEGIRAVLNGNALSFTIEYSCFPKKQDQWYLMTVTPLANEYPNGAVVMHLNITKRKQAEDRLRHLALAMDGTTDAIYLVNRNTMKYVHVNDAACNMNNKRRDQLIQTPPWEILSSTRVELEFIYDCLIKTGVAAEPTELLRRRADGSEFWVELRQQAEISDGCWKIITVERDISERREAGIRLHHMAHYDELTGLPNRKLFYEGLSKALLASAISKRIVCVMFIDLDHFKNVNDTLGHSTGDELLIQFGCRLSKCVRTSDTVGRLGGDEFAIIMPMEDDCNNAAIVASKIREILHKPFDINGHEIKVTASIGITMHPNDALDIDTLIKYADTAMYQAKQAGRNTYRFFTAQMNLEVLARLELENALHRALQNGEFILYYQPKLALKTGLISGVEALIRWERPGIGLVSPVEFIPVLEDTGLIVEVGNWVIREACKQIGLWMNSPVGPIQVAVNVSSRQFIEGDLHGVIIKSLKDNNLPAHLLELELTESTLMINTNRTSEILQNLIKEGVNISIDDFGTGYSSLAYLRRFPIEKLKIDIDFIRNVTTNEDDAAITQAIIKMAHSLNLEVVSEGVETIDQLNFLQSKGTDHIQGNFFSVPLPVDQMESMLLEKNWLT